MPPRDGEPFRNVVNISVPTLETIKPVLYDELEGNPFRYIKYMQINTSHVARNLKMASSALSHSSEYQEQVRGRPQIRISCEASRRTKL
ncbi:hypothetical protein FRX31_017403 [Thalictrum thalictroides]|uniref:Uncharacterized protein n=1 Tax=Thalictrum thalictroides TaxID=46969 RepID=A0A7J6W9X0_THATH|nr:hypothetical protein FRX31_017403 [Thalictrum thalictroides]